jgi:hypothetical protein
VIAASGAAKDDFIGLGWGSSMAVMSITDAANANRRSSSRQRERNKSSGKCEQQQKSGGEALHRVPSDYNGERPQVESA